MAVEVVVVTVVVAAVLMPVWLRSVHGNCSLDLSAAMHERRLLVTVACVSVSVSVSISSRAALLLWSRVARWMSIESWRHLCRWLSVMRSAW